MALPDTVVSFETTGGDNPPHKSSGGAYYVVVGNSSNPIDVYKSTDPGTASWVVQDATGNPAEQPDDLLGSVSDGSFIHVVSIDSGSFILAYHRFNMSTDAWDQVDDQVADLSGMDSPTGSLSGSITIRAGVTGDELVIVSSGTPDSVMGSLFNRVDFWHGPDSGTPSWTGPVSVDGRGLDVNRVRPTAFIGSSDAVHVFWSTSGGGENIRTAARTISTTNTLSTIRELDYGVTSGSLGDKRATSFDVSGTQRVGVTTVSPSGGNENFIRGDEDGSNNIGTLTREQDITPTSVFSRAIKIGSNVQILYSGTSQDLFVIESTDDGVSWGSDSELVDAITLTNVSPSELDTGILAYMYSTDTGTFYNEEAAVGAFSADLTAASFATAAQSLTWSGEYTGSLSTASFNTVPQSISVDQMAEMALTSASFPTTAQPLSYIAEYTANLSTAPFQTTALDITVEEVALDYVAELTTASFPTIAQSLGWDVSYTSDLTAAIFETTANSLTYTANYLGNLTTASFITSPKGLIIEGDYGAILSTAPFDTLAQNLTVAAGFNTNLTSASFITTANDLTWISDYITALSVASFGTTSQPFTISSDYLAELSVASFSMTGNDITILSSILNNLTSASFPIVPNNIEISASLLSAGFHRIAVIPDNDDEAGGGFHNKSSGTGGGQGGFHNSSTGTSGGEGGFYNP